MEIKLNTTTKEIKETIGKDDKGKSADQIDAEKLNILIAALVIVMKGIAHNKTQEDVLIKKVQETIERIAKNGQFGYDSKEDVFS